MTLILAIVALVMWLKGHFLWAALFAFAMCATKR